MLDLDKFVFHYTGADALLNIVTGRKLWATNIEYLNDRYEGEQPSRLLEKIADNPKFYLGNEHRVPTKHLEALKHSLRSRHMAITISFSRDYRSLPQFRMYSPPAGGYVIGFPRDYLQRVDSLLDCDYSYESLLAWCTAYVTEYSDEAMKRDNQSISAEQLNNELVQTTNLIMRRVEAGLRFKSDEFINEKEVRLYTFGPPARYRASRDGNYVIPYTPIELPNEAVDVMLVAGPNRDPPLATLSVGNFMQAAKAAGTNWQFAHLGAGEFGFRC